MSRKGREQWAVGRGRHEAVGRGAGGQGRQGKRGTVGKSLGLTKKWLRFAVLFVGTVLAFVMLSVDGSRNAVVAAVPSPQAAALLPAAQPQVQSQRNFAGSLGTVETNYAAYCQGDAAIAKPMCGGVGEGEVAVSSPRTDFVLEVEKAPLEPIVLYQYDKVVLARSGG
jgi:hypothetical protein